jgi:hypothetical protein
MKSKKQQKRERERERGEKFKKYSLPPTKKKKTYSIVKVQTIIFSFFFLDKFICFVG